MVEVVLFDFGGVVLRTPFELLETDWQGPFAPEDDDLWQLSMDGVITEREYWHRRASSLHPQAADPTFALMRELYEDDEHRIIRPEVLQLLDRLDDAGLRTAVLTNDLSAFHPQEWVDRIGALQRFERVIDLSDSGVLKPAPAAFERALRLLDVDASQVLFVDDQPGNVTGARAVGLHAVWFDPTDVAGSVAEVADATGVSVPATNR